MAVLGALSIEPMTGYALREAIRDVLGHFWSESFGQIYPAFGELERHGCCDTKRIHESRFVDVRHHAIRRRARLRDLLEQPVQTTPPRNGLLLRLFFGRSLGVDACRALITQAKAEAQRRLDEFDAIATQVAGEANHADDAPFWLLTISAGRHNARAALAWAEESLAALDSVEKDKQR